MLTKHDTGMIEKVLNKRNLQRAYAQVVQNGGSAGVDGVTVRELREQLREHWPAIALDVVHMRYLPQPIKGVEIPKGNGKTRLLGIPTTTERFLQQMASCGTWMDGCEIGCATAFGTTGKSWNANART